MKKHFIQLFEYDRWANARLIEAIETHEVIDDRILSLISHIIWAENAWLMRINKQQLDSYTPFAMVPINELKEQVVQVDNQFSTVVNGIEDFSATIEYTNSTGAAFTSTLEDVLTHVLNHGTYHRGQIATRFKEIGLTPPPTDYIVFTRS